ncbi:MAG: hypothetical protein DRI84_03650 [Bacteroidetes bacterium]|nr:MAG: hypothetical protein DRI84_03650 [Bacteroidota bacterium]
MIKKLFFAVLFSGMIIPSFLLAQLSGTKTIGGTSPDYATFALAVSALNSSGVNGPVVFNVAPGTYTEQISINSISGASATNTITFKSSNNDSTAVILNYASSTNATNNYVVNLNGPDYIIFKKMTIERTGTNSYAVVVNIVGTSNYVSFENNIIKNGAVGSVSNFTSLIYAPNGTGNIHTNQTYYNNKFVNGGIGIYNFGAGANTLCVGTKVENNIFQNQGKWAMALWYQDGTIITENQINAISTSTNYYAIYGNYCSNALRIQRNKFSLVGGVAIYLQQSASQNAQLKGLITNNFISMSGASAKAFYYSNSSNHHIYYNSVRLSAASSVGFYLTGTQSTAIRYMNNIIQVGSSSMCMEITNTTTPFSSLDNNAYYFPGGSMGKYKTSTVHSSLSAWQTATSMESNSINTNPNFTSATDLHIISSSLAQQGTSALTTPSVSIDIDGQTRSATTPDIGADEFSIKDFMAVSVQVSNPMCHGKKYNVTFTLKNNGTAPVSKVLPVKYQIASVSSIITELANIQNLAPGASYTHTFTAQLNATSAGTYKLKGWFNMQDDANHNNDTASMMATINPYPVLNLPIDTTICGGKSVVLDPGAGFDSYLWYNSDTTQTLSVDSTGIGFGARWIAVAVTDGGCTTSDSTLVIFSDCTGIKDIEFSRSLSIYPNPAIDMVNIEVSSSAVLRKVEILSIDGQLIQSNEQGDLSRISISTLPKGIYYLKIESNNGIAIKKLIKQ